MISILTLYQEFEDSRGESAEHSPMPAIHATFWSPSNMLELGNCWLLWPMTYEAQLSGAHSRLAIRAAEFGPEADFRARRVDEKTTTTESPQP